MAYSLQAATVRHILPKANEIVDTAQEDFKSIYPFELKKMRHLTHMSDKKNDMKFQYNRNNYVNTFKPYRKTVKQHFNPKDLIYDKFNNNFDDKIFNMNIFSVERLKNLRNNDFIINREQTQQFSVKNQQSQLVFDSRFECGNLSLVSNVEDRFFLLLHNDVNTSGYTNWFYFSVQPKKLGKYKFAIMNYGKAGWSFGLGTGICCRANNQWERGGQNVFCQSNAKIFSDSDPYVNSNTLSFQYEFVSYEKAYFSYNIPYSYTDLLMTLDEIQRQKYSYYHRKLAGTTICGNRIQMLTIGNFQKHKLSNTQQMPVVVLLARSHAGQTVSSWILHYFLKFLLSNQLKAKLLRDRFLFKIFPMINPDGVIHGNYRCSLIGRDLNRRWNKAVKQLYPEVYYVKNQILELSQKKIIKLVIDLHGHTQKKQAFFFGCNDKNQPHKCRLFPYLLSKISPSYDFSSCNFCINKSKLSTARITLFMLLKNCDVFTLQTSQFGLRNQVFDKNSHQQVGQSLAKGMYFYFKLNKATQAYHKSQQGVSKDQKQALQFEQAQKKYEQTPEEYEQSNFDADKLQKQIIEDSSLLKFGNQKDYGSDSEPSVCNINFDKLNKMSNRKDMKINTSTNNQVSKPKKNVNRVLVTNKRLEMTKKSIDLLPISLNNRQLPAPKRFASTSHNFRKNSQDYSEYHNLIKTTNRFQHKGQSQRGLSTPSITAHNRNMKKQNPQQLVKMVNFQLFFQGFNSHSPNKKRKFRSTNNSVINNIFDVRINNFVNYTQPSLTRPYSYLYKNKK